MCGNPNQMQALAAPQLKPVKQQGPQQQGPQQQQGLQQQQGSQQQGPLLTSQQQGLQQRPPELWEKDKLDSNEWLVGVEKMEQVTDLKNAQPEQINLERAQNMVSAASQTVVSEFNTGKQLSGKSKNRRKKAFESKKKLYDSAEAKEWRKDHADGKQEWRNPTNPTGAAGASPTPQPKIKDKLDVIKQMHDCTIDFLNYNNDEAFIAHFSDAYKQLDSFAALKEVFQNPGQEELKKLKEEKLPNVEKLKEMVDEYTRIRDFYRAKMDVISSPFYMVLRKTDTSKLTVEQIDESIQKCHADGRTQLEDYLKAINVLKKLDKNDVGHNLHAHYRKQTGGGMDKKKGAYFAVGVRDYGINAEAKAGIGLSGSNDDGKYDEGHKEYWDKEEEIKEKHKEKREKKAEENGFDYDDISLDIVNLKAEAQASASALEAGGYLKSTHGTLQAAAVGDLLSVKASGGVGASLSLNTKDFVDLDVGISGDASFTVAKGKIGASALKDTKVGTFGASLDANGELGTAEVSGLAKLGRFSTKIKGEEVVLNGIGLSVNAQLAAASGSVTGGFTLFGVKVGVTLSGMIGAGANAGVYLSTSRVGWSLGATMGLGGNVSMDLDFSYWTDKLKSKIVSKVKDKFFK